jgi:hypothetical protein
MDYLTQVFQLNPPTVAVRRPLSSPESEFARQLGSHQFGDFTLTRAIRPSSKSTVRPVQGFRYDKYVDESYPSEIPVIMAAASSELLFPLFVQLIQRLGDVVDVVLETSHDHELTGHRDLFREQIDMPILTSALWEFDDLLLNDGCTGIAVLNPDTPQEVQFDEHKMLIMYGQPLEHFEQILEDFDVACQPSMRFITEGEHIHASNEVYRRQFQQLKSILGTESERD